MLERSSLARQVCHGLLGRFIYVEVRVECAYTTIVSRLPLANVCKAGSEQCSAGVSVPMGRRYAEHVHLRCAKLACPTCQHHGVTGKRWLGALLRR